MTGLGLANGLCSAAQSRTYERFLSTNDRILCDVGASDGFCEIGSRVSDFFFYIRGGVFEGLAGWFVSDEAGYCSCM